MDTYLPMDQLEPRRVYWLHSRNLVVGAWQPETQGFIGVRHKFSNTYLFTEYHYDTGAPVGTACPLAPAGELWVPEGVRMHENAAGTWCGDASEVEVVRGADGRRVHVTDGRVCTQPYVHRNEDLFALLEPIDRQRLEERAREYDTRE